MATRYHQATIVVTARKAGYYQRTVLAGFSELEVLDFRPDDIKQFVLNWFAFYPDPQKRDNASDLNNILEHNPRIQALAANPLLLSLIVIVYENHLDLPERRAELYKQCIDTLLTKWDASRNIRRQRAFKPEQKRQLLEEVAWHFHRQGQRYFPENELLEVIANFLPTIGLMVEQNRQVLDEIAAENGLLKEQAPGWHGFLHLTLQEYFAAQYAVDQQQLDTLLAQRNDPWWEEIFLLYAGLIPDASQLLQRLLGLTRQEGLQDDVFHTDLLLAGRCLAVHPTIRQVSLREEVISRLFQALVTSRYLPTQRQTAETLAEIGGATVSAQLLALLSNEQLDRSVRMNIVTALGQLGERSAVTQLVILLSNEQLDRSVRMSIADSLYQLGLLAQEQQHWEQAEAYYQQALQLYLEFDDRQKQADAFYQLGLLAQEQQRWKQAEAYYQQALQLYLEFDDRQKQADAFYQLGLLAQEQQHWEQAEAYYQQALQLYLEFDDRQKQADAFYQLGLLAQEQQHWEQAEAYYQQALDISVALNDLQRKGELRMELGRVLQQQGHWEEAASQFEDGLRVVHSLGDLESEIQFLINLGHIHQSQDRWDEAIQHYEQALSIAGAQYRSSDPIVQDIVTTISNIAQRRDLRSQSALLQERALASMRLFLEQAGITIGREDGRSLEALTAQGALKRFAPFPIFLATGTISAEDLKELVEHSNSQIRGRQERIGILIYDKPPDAVLEIRISLLQLDDHFMLIPIPFLEVEQTLSDRAACKGLLADYINRYLSTNVFDDRYAVHDPLFFFGRRELLHRLEADLVKGQGVGLFGLRKSGKTSVLLQLRSILRKHPVVHIDLERYGGNRYGAQLLNGILQRLLTLIAERAPDLTPHLDEFPTDLSAAELTTRFIQSMEIYAQALEKSGYELPIICLLDEVERVLPQVGDAREKAEEFNACFGVLRALIQEQRILGLMVTDVYPDCNRINEWPQEGVPTNPVFQFFQGSLFRSIIGRRNNDDDHRPRKMDGEEV